MQTAAYRRAITRQVSATFHACALEFQSRQRIDVDLARAQHAAYVAALQANGLEVTVLPADDRYPDGCFVEDTAVILDGTALITRMGAASREGEQHEVARVLGRFQELVVMEAPATLDGGDVLRVERTLFAGQSRRTNAEGIRFLERVGGAQGFQVIAVPVSGRLHLKTAVSYLGGGRLLAAGEAGEPIRAAAGVCTLLRVPDGAEYAANVVALANEILAPRGFPQVTDLLRTHCGAVRELAMSEFAKAEGGLTCLSILL